MLSEILDGAKSLKILFHVSSYYPAIGGVESATLNLARELVSLKQQVVVLTRSKTSTEDEHPMPGYSIVRNPTPKQLVSWTAWCDVCVHENVNLRTLWTRIFVKKPWVVIHHHRMRRLEHADSAPEIPLDTRRGIAPQLMRGFSELMILVNYRIKRLVTRFADANIAVSASLAVDFSFPMAVLPNCYDRQTFIPNKQGIRDRHVIFVGRFVTEKGHWILLKALAILKREGVLLKGTFIGEGPQLESLRISIVELGLQDQIQYAGPTEGEKLARLFSRHHICVIPSVVPETFGLVALESMSCGCAIVSSDDGAIPGLADKAGITFKSGNAFSLAERLLALYNDEPKLQAMQHAAVERAAQFEPNAIAKRYLTIFENLGTHSRPIPSSRVSSRCILIISTFCPNIGGIETVFDILSREWARAGHLVRVIHPGPVQYHSDCFLGSNDVPIHYQPNWSSTLDLHKWCDICIHGSLNTRYLGGVLITGKPCIITQHGSVTSTGLIPLSSTQKVKRWISRRFPNITCSEFVARDLGIKPLVTGNPFRDEVFYFDATVNREGDFIFVGRIVTDKGLPLLLNAVNLLHSRGEDKGLTVIGTGPELAKCRVLADQLGISSNVRFLGVMEPLEVAAELRAHRVLVIPSEFHEPFGIVALEGIACGCNIVASRAGGMPESVGNCGILYENGSLESLVVAMTQAWKQEPADFSVRSNQLRRFKPSNIAGAYLEAMETVIRGHGNKADRRLGCVQTPYS